MNNKFIDTNNIKVVKTADFNMHFNKHSGYTEIYGKTEKDNPETAPAPTHLDIEICGGCDGHMLHICGIKTKNGNIISPCYKSNSNLDMNEYMSFETFKELFKNFDKRYLTQIAFGTDARLCNNPDIWKILEYTRSEGIIPNLTCAYADKDTAKELVRLCGGIAVSRYHDKRFCYETIHNLLEALQKSKRKFMDINMHILVCEENYNNILETIKDYHTDERLKGMNAIVLLTLKQIGRGIYFHQLSYNKYKNIIKEMINNNIIFGADSCGCIQFYNALKETNSIIAENNKENIERCESSRYSFYIDYKGKGYPCSFCPGSKDWKEGIDIISNFWNHPKVLEFRKININCKNDCPVYGNLFMEENK